MDTIYYYGAIGSAGHYLWESDTRSYHVYDQPHPWGRKIDGTLTPEDISQGEGIALVTHKQGWTALSFWDRTVDKRRGSHSTYVINSIHTFEEMVILAKENFPKRWGAMSFEVVEVEATNGLS